MNNLSDWFIFLPFITLGLVSSAHCVGMCGGIMAALTVSITQPAQSKRWLLLVAYNIGRIGSYGLMGFVLALFSQLFHHWAGGIVVRLIAGALMIAMGLYLANIWRGLIHLERVGRYLWVYLQPLSKYLLPVDKGIKALALGALWGWLPCGLIYSALALSLTQPSAALAGAAMLAFGMGTLPAVLMVGITAHHLSRLLQTRSVRLGLGGLMMLYGIWTMSASIIYGGHQHGAQIEQPSSLNIEIQHRHHREPN
ncbi:MAG TPA: sulfite exporter TauE/SafE family protein [Cellvibrionaceae bacterium]|nr:sulfite exporter TauE/SafE family protein [Cellvibrionaceae bacterium]HNG59697.1 sulfite exporter TauE/SafE family protein [Cellvibrionaceae bacterium]